MSKNYKVFHVKGERPVVVKLELGNFDVPADWLIFNAPRPLHGSFTGPREYDVPVTWTGNFHHGVFYAAVDPNDLDRITHNVALDGWVLEWHSDKEIQDFVKKYFSDYYPGLEIDYNDFTQSEFDNSFFAVMNNR